MTAIQAKLRRLREIEKLQACTCNYPLQVCRNMCGHPIECPAYQIWERHVEEDKR